MDPSEPFILCAKDKNKNIIDVANHMHVKNHKEGQGENLKGELRKEDWKKEEQDRWIGRGGDGAAQASNGWRGLSERGDWGVCRKDWRKVTESKMSPTPQ